MSSAPRLFATEGDPHFPNDPTVPSEPLPGPQDPQPNPTEPAPPSVPGPTKPSPEKPGAQRPASFALRWANSLAPAAIAASLHVIYLYMVPISSDLRWPMVVSTGVALPTGIIRFGLSRKAKTEPALLERKRANKWGAVFAGAGISCSLILAILSR